MCHWLGRCFGGDSYEVACFFNTRSGKQPRKGTASPSNVPSSRLPTNGRKKSTPRYAGKASATAPQWNCALWRCNGVRRGLGISSSSSNPMRERGPVTRSVERGPQGIPSLTLRVTIERLICTHANHNSSRNPRGRRAAIAFSSSTDCQSVASSLLLVDLHCGHCRAALLPFGTVGNGRFGPAGRDCSPRNSPNNVREKGTAAICRNSPEGAAHIRCLSPFSLRRERADRSHACPTRRIRPLLPLPAAPPAGSGSALACSESAGIPARRRGSLKSQESDYTKYGVICQ